MGKEILFIPADIAKILYGIGVREKPEPGNSSNDGVLQTYDSKNPTTTGTGND